MEFPPRFRERYSSIVDEPDAFFASLERRTPKSFRVNTIKADADEVEARLRGYGIGLKKIAWYPDAFISDNYEIGSSYDHFAGNIYIQELSSMLPPLIIREELGSASYVLDACAAPGSKTTETAAFMGNRGTIVANDIDYSRIRALKSNVERTGALNVVITNQDIRFFPPVHFDAILVDAPCSAEGTIRKTGEALDSWNEKKLRGQAMRQKQILLKAFDLLKPGGVLVYSTCTFAPEENEGVIDHLIKSREDARLKDISVDGFKLAPAISSWQGHDFDTEVAKCRRVWPHHNDTEGFFLAKVTK